MNEAGDLERVTALFVAMGAGRRKAEVMASQLMKRADQLAQERGIEKSQSLAELLGKVLEARSPSASPTSSGLKVTGRRGS